MIYTETILKAYQSVKEGSNLSNALMQKALQYENWRNLPDFICQKIKDHEDYCHLVASLDTCPTKYLPEESSLVSDCQIDRECKTIEVVYSLCRPREQPSLPLQSFEMMEDVDFQKIHDQLLEKGKFYSGKLWITTCALSLRSHEDLANLIQRLGLYHWRNMSPYGLVFCLKWSDLPCVKPNALDANLEFYFHQTPEQEPAGRTRNLRTGNLDMEEYLHEGDKEKKPKHECVGWCIASRAFELSMDEYYKNNAERIRNYRHE